MVQPNLIHPTPVELEFIDEGKTMFDPDTKEPLPSVVRGTKKILKAQIKYFTEKELVALETGPAEGSKGYLLFRDLDLAQAGVEIKQGVKITKIGKRASDYYITGTVPMGHYPDQGGHSLLRANFADREPVQ